MAYRLSILLSLFLVVSTSAEATIVDEVREETERLLSRASDGSPKCFPDISGQAKAHIVSVYQGTEPASADSKHPFRYVDVRLEATTEPALLVLTAYEPVVWRVEVATHASLMGVVLSGYHEQLVSGLPENIPIGRSRYHDRVGAVHDCADLLAERDHLAKGNYIRTPGTLSTVEEGLGRRGEISIVSYQWSYEGDRFSVSDASISNFVERKRAGKAELTRLAPPEYNLLNADAERLAVTDDLIGKNGLNYFVERGYLLVDDGRARHFYCDRTTATSLAAGIEPQQCQINRRQVAYVVLGPIVFPPGLCGAHRAVFFLPKGVPEPEGDGCHSRIVRLDEPPCVERRSECSKTGTMRD